LEGLGVGYHLAHLSKTGVVCHGPGWAGQWGWPGGTVISHGCVCAMEYRHAIAFLGHAILHLAGGSHPPTGFSAATASFCLHHVFFFSNAWACRTFNVVIINLIDLDFNSFILEQLAKMLLTQKVYARLVSSILRRFPFKYTFDINFDLTTGVLFKLL